MNYDDIQIGKYYKLRDWNGTRPRRWNTTGMMDKYAGRTVLVTAKKFGQTIRIDQDGDQRYTWSFQPDDFETPVDLLEDELFEI